MSTRANTCPCCGGSLLRHARHGELYWFCLSCRQEVPLLSINRLSNLDSRNTAVLTQTAVDIASS
jgi:ribosomal protein L37AE/L43A